MKNTLLIFCLATIIVSCEKADYDESCPEETTFQSRSCEETDSTDTSNVNVGIEKDKWGATVNVNF